ncbi:MAG: hypothetical protein JSR92_19765 [Proteobacteria bacterium]|nr:hypothetical protein [Pseudomonadota bacterium]MBS2011222.1 hypothetical protein [Cyanobacteria bacterium SZAS TMP-1]
MSKSSIEFPDIWEPGINREAWVEWVEYKRDVHKFRYSTIEKYWRKAQRMLTACGNADEQQAAVDRSIGNNWQGLFPVGGLQQERISWRDL